MKSTTPTTPTSNKKKSSSSLTPSSAAKSPSSSGPTYAQMIHDAIVALKDRTGSSQPAIAKWIKANHPQVAETLQFKQRLNQALKTGVRNKRFAKIKASFKISNDWKAKEKARKSQKRKAAVKAKAKAVKKKQALQKVTLTLEETLERNAKKLKELQETLSPEELAKERQKMQRKEEALKRKQEAERLAKLRAERLRRRRFPMEDTKLHKEDAELQVKPPSDVISRPYLPYFWYLTHPLSDPSRLGKTSSMVLSASKADALDFGSRGLVSDLLQVYHFFRGDVHFVIDYPIVPDFSLKQLIFATEEVLNGQSKTNRMIPPLLVHLFCTCLQILCQEPTELVEEDMGLKLDEDDPVSKGRLQLQKDFHKFLAGVISPASWADVCFLYMDAMERYYTTNSSRDRNVLPSLNTDIEYLLGVKDQPVVPMTPFLKKKPHGGETDGDAMDVDEEQEAVDSADKEVPDGYCGYLGDPQGSLNRAFYKLGRQDPWQLTAEELMAILRALTDDILASHPAVSKDMAAREEEMQVLLKAKRAADAKFRKMRLAFEGPKKPAKKATKPATENGDDDKAAAEEAKDDSKEVKEEEKPFKPTVSRKQFEAAMKAQQRASDAYEKGIRNLVARTEPVGYDRHFNAVYCFRHDPEVLYVEDLRSPSGVAGDLPEDLQFPRRSWHVIETTSLFDAYACSLDIRGRREHDLYEELMGPSGAQQSLRRYLYDDVKEQADANAKLKEMEALKKRLEIARMKCDEEKGRRSGRLAGQAEEELLQVENDIEQLEKQIKGEAEPEPRDYDELTGLDLLRQFDSAGRLDTRRTREQKESSKSRKLKPLQCSKLVNSGDIDGTGIIGMMVSGILQLEERCEALSPWDGVDRSAWISTLEGAVLAWNGVSSTPPGTPASMNGARRDSLESTSSANKRRKLNSPGSTAPLSGSNLPSTTSILGMFKQPLLELEARIADMTNLAAASRDADLADENMSTDGSEDDKERLERAWKRIVHKIRLTPTRRHVQIREMVVAAIAAARKAHLPEIVAELRAALLLHHPNAAKECKMAAVAVLESHGDYEEDEDDYDSDEEDEGNKEEPEEQVPSVLAADAVVIASSLGGSDDARREDWIYAVKGCKTLSRMASLAAGFVHDANEQLDKIEVEHEDLLEAVTKWEKEEERRQKCLAENKTFRPSKNYSGPSEVWANVRFTDEICMAKAEDYPWWPAKKCEVRDPSMAKSLDDLNRCLVSLIGEMGGLRVVKRDTDVKPFTGKAVETEELEQVQENSQQEEDLVGLDRYSKEMRNQLDDCMTMARRILRGIEKRAMNKKKKSRKSN